MQCLDRLPLRDLWSVMPKAVKTMAKMGVLMRAPELDGAFWTGRTNTFCFLLVGPGDRVS